MLRRLGVFTIPVLLIFSCYDVVDEGTSGKDGGKVDAGTEETRDGAVAVDSGVGVDAHPGDSGFEDSSVGVDAGDESDVSIQDAGHDAGADAGADSGTDSGVDPCAGHCSNQKADCGETGVDCGGECAACPDPCANHCTNQQTDCGETGVDCGGECAACGDPCDGHCFNAKADCGESGKDCGGECSPCGSGGCSFPQGVPEEDFTGGTGNDGTIAAAVNSTMSGMSGCNVGSDCYIGDQYPDAQQWFVAVAQALRDQGFCAGQHELGYTDEIAVSNTGCTGRWYGYHIFNYGGSKVVWNPGAQRGWWSIDPKWCAGQ